MQVPADKSLREHVDGRWYLPESVAYTRLLAMNRPFDIKALPDVQVRGLRYVDEIELNRLMRAGERVERTDKVVRAKPVKVHAPRRRISFFKAFAWFVVTLLVGIALTLAVMFGASLVADSFEESSYTHSVRPAHLDPESSVASPSFAFDDFFGYVRDQFLNR